MASGGDQLETPNPGRWRLIAGFVVLLALAAFVLVLWFVFQDAQVTGRGGDNGVVPVVRAPDSPDRQRPTEPGGAPVPDRDKSVFNTFNRNDTSDSEAVERLLPAPEAALPDTLPPIRPDGEAIDAETDTDSDTDNVIVVSERPEPVLPPADAAPAAPVPPSRPAEPAQTIADLVVRSEKKTAETKPAAPATTASTASGAWQAQLAAFRDEASAREAWVAAQKKLPDILGGQQPDIVRADLGDRGVYYRLRTGDFASKSAAEAFCKPLVAQGQGCIAAKR